MKKSPRKLRNFIINKKFQFSVIAYFLFLSLILILIFYISHTYLFGSLQLKVYTEKITDPRDLFILMEEFTSDMNTVFLITSIIAVLVTALCGIYLSHRIAGPIYRLGKFLNEKKPVLSLRELHFRKHDFFPELEESFNTFLSHIKRAFKEDKKT